MLISSSKKPSIFHLPFQGLVYLKRCQSKSDLKVGPYLGAPLVAQPVKHLPAMQENQVQSLGPKDPLEKEMGTHPREFQRNAWRIPQTGAWWSQSWMLASDFLFHSVRQGFDCQVQMTLYNKFVFQSLDVVAYNVKSVNNNWL